MTKVKKTGLIGCLGVASAIAVSAAQFITPSSAIAEAPITCKCGAQQVINGYTVNNIRPQTQIAVCICGDIQCVVNLTGHNMQCMK